MILTKQMQKNLSNYKYACRDTSPLSNLVMHPFWDWVTKFYPMWLSPNLLTFLGFLLTVAHFLFLTCLNPDFTHPENVPSWIWLLIGIMVFVAHTMDGTDGKQARRTKSSSALGELFDHGCDSWAIHFLPVAIFSLYGNLTDPTRLFVLHWILLWTFILSHWEKYITGVLFLPWSFDIAQLGVVGVCFIAYYFGIEIFATPVFSGLVVADAFQYVLLASFFLMQIPSTIYNVRYDCPPSTPWHRGRGTWEALRPLIPMFIATATSFIWLYCSPTRIVDQQPRLFLYCIGTIASNISCHLILAQMCASRAPILNALVSLYSIVALGLVAYRHSAWVASAELATLIALSIIATVLHIRYAYNVVLEIADTLKISVFKINVKKVDE